MSGIGKQRCQSYQETRGWRTWSAQLSLSWKHREPKLNTCEATGRQPVDATEQNEGGMGTPASVEELRRTAALPLRGGQGSVMGSGWWLLAHSTVILPVPLASWRPLNMRAAVVTGFLAFLSPSAVVGEPIECGSVGVSVTAPDPAITDLVCNAAEVAARQLDLCGLPLEQPVLVRVLDDFATNHNNCAALFDCKTMSVDIASPDALKGMISADSPWSQLSMEEYFASVVAHELAHAAFQQAVGDRVVDPTDHEYVAYAMQMQFLSALDRSAIISSFPVKPPVAASELNGIIAFMAPVLFAAKTWTHFTGPVGGCDFVRSLARGERTLGLGEWPRP
jgi:hypothetical protein